MTEQPLAGCFSAVYACRHSPCRQAERPGEAVQKKRKGKNEEKHYAPHRRAFSLATTRRRFDPRPAPCTRVHIGCGHGERERGRADATAYGDAAGAVGDEKNIGFVSPSYCQDIATPKENREK